MCVVHSCVVCVHSNRSVLYACCVYCECCDMLLGVCICMCDVGVIGDSMSECVCVGFGCMLWFCAWCPSMIGVYVSGVCVCVVCAWL